MSARRKTHSEPIVSARDIVNRFGSQLVHDKISLDVMAGEILGIAGGSGSGKSVLLKTLTGLHTPDAGSVLLDGTPIALAGLPAETGLKFPAELSGGMVKRAALARSLALDPRILFLDEPTSGLDPTAASGIDALILQLNKALGITVVVVTHDLTTLFTVCRRVAILADRKITVNTIDRLMQSQQPWIHEFLHGARAQGAMNARKHPHGNG